ncbi:zinc finger BED domain-containing protein RICESLEEPER 3-like [Tripterygium wilfordii]|uniref:zinc finger BED domain-containing protein RICESLEEPER 3-like n=1 Tax=Tripterygium wilfordii TaxID=458696 RepID=UPI0018F8453C|nr:zinc finger BED domain-containing protein RICESLEEPER 3-like [Tripterygium wilfordii]
MTNPVSSAPQILGAQEDAPVITQQNPQGPEAEKGGVNNDENDNPSKRSGRKGKPTSWLWDHFEYIEGPPIKARCHYCSSAYLCSSKSHGITNLKNHYGKCEKSPFRKVPKGQKTLAFKSMKMEDGTSSGVDLRAVSFNIEVARKALAKMVIIDELPFRCVEGDGFRIFVQSLQPLFKVPSRMTVARDCMKIFMEEKEMLKKQLRNEMGIEKLFTVTVDNASSNDGAIKHLKLVTRDWKGTVLGHEFIHMRCCAHILNLIVRDVLDEHDESISRIRNSIRYVRSSPARLSTFRKCVDKVKIDCKQSLCLDVDTRWNSTYMMLDVALKYEKAFKRLESDNRRYCKYFDKREIDVGGHGTSDTNVKKGKGKLNKTIGPPTEQDWKYARSLVMFLKLFYHMTLRFSTSLNVSSNSFFLKIVSLHSRLLDLCKSTDSDMKLMADRMKLKFDKY